MTKKSTESNPNNQSNQTLWKTIQAQFLLPQLKQGVNVPKIKIRNGQEGKLRW